MSATTENRRDNQGSPLWALILIAVGAVWLLAQANILSRDNLVVLFRLWPVILIAVGLELLFGRGSRSLSLLIGAATVIVLLVLMIVGPSIGLVSNANVETAQYSEPVGDTTSAQMDLNLSVGTVTINALSDTNDLIDADLRYIGDVHFDVSSAGSEKFVTLRAENDSTQWFDFLGFSFIGADGDQLRWNIGLTPLVPLDLRLKGGVGTNNIDLSGVQLSNLSYQGGVGETTITLADGDRYAVSLDGGVGQTTLRFAAATAVDARIQGGVGEIFLDIPDDAPVRLQSEGGLGGVNVSGTLARISGDDNNGVWETASYSGAGSDQRITIEVEGGVGGLTVR